MGFKITDYPAKTVFNDTDLYDCSTGATTSEKVTYAQVKTNLNSSLSFLSTVPSGVCGISDSSGVITFYADLNTAITAATSGEVVTLYADITETTNVSVDLKTGVNVNLNGYTYTLSQVGTASSFGDNALAVECSLYNGTILRAGGSDSTANSVALFLDNPLSVVTLNGVHLSCDFCAAIIEGELIGGTIGSDGGTNAVYCNGGTVRNIRYSGFGRFHLDGASKGYNIDAFALGHEAIFTRAISIIYDCIGESLGGEGIKADAGKAYNCTGISSNTTGFWANAAVIYGCKGVSSALYGMESDTEAHRCIGISTMNLGLYSNGGSLYDCTASSSADRAIHFNGGLDLVRCTAITTSNVATHHAMTVGDSGATVSKCYASVVHASAYALSGSTYTAFVTALTGDGMNTLLNISANSQVNTEDTFGNILLG